MRYALKARARSQEGAHQPFVDQEQGQGGGYMPPAQQAQAPPQSGQQGGGYNAPVLAPPSQATSQESMDAQARRLAALDQ